MWKHLVHPNIVPLLGVISPLQLISEWMSSGDLMGYLEIHPGKDRLSLVRALRTAPYDILTSSSVIRCC